MESILSAAGIIDSHAHYFDRRFAAESEGADVILARDVFGAGVSAVLNVGTNNQNNRIVIEQAKQYPRMYAAVGLHPEDVQFDRLSLEDELPRLRELLDTVEKRAAHKIVALGEIGLDYHVEEPDKALQASFFEAQLALAAELGIPVIIHDREAHGDCFETVLRYPTVRGVFHSFSGSADMARELCRRGWYVSFSGVLTFKNARRAIEAAAAVPHDRVLIETDAPYLAPVPYRGRINHSGLMCYTAQVLASVWGVSYDEAVAQTAKNTRTLFDPCGIMKM